MKDETTGNASDSSFILHPSSFVFRNGPVVQRQRPLAYTQVTMVRVHPGSLHGLLVQFGTTPGLHPGNRGSTPRRSTVIGPSSLVICQGPMTNLEGSRIWLAGPLC